MSNLQTDPKLKEIIRRHAFERDVKPPTLMRDILTIWCHIVTDLNDPYFTGVTPLDLPPMPPERRPGYLQSLCFELEEDHLGRLE